MLLDISNLPCNVQSSVYFINTNEIPFCFKNLLASIGVIYYVKMVIFSRVNFKIIMLFLHVKISCFQTKAHLVDWCLHDNNKNNNNKIAIA